MDLAAQRITTLAQRILPDRPHHLSVSPTRRYPAPVNFWQHHSHSNLQYSTFLSDTDRGILLTRPYYEILEEPKPSTTSPAKAGPRQEIKKPVTKMSFQDYQNSKKKLSLSPLTSGAPAKPNAKAHRTDESKPTKTAVKVPDGKGRVSDAPASCDVAPREDTSKRPKPLSRDNQRNGRSPSPDSGRRSPYHPESGRPSKKTRIEDSVKSESRTPNSETKQLLSASYDRTAQKEFKEGTLQPPNGRSVLTQKNGDVSTSHHGSAVNGIKTITSTAITTTTTATTHRQGTRKTESSSKPSVPPLLSPLRLSLDDDHGSKARSPAKQHQSTEPGAHGRTTTKGPKADEGPPPRKQKPAFTIPPLLSPTLPAIVELELSRTKGTPSKEDQGHVDSQTSESPIASKKTTTVQGEAEKERPYLVRLKYKKKNSLRVQRILALEPASRKEALKKERSMSAEVASPPAKKRPRPADAVLESVASKRPKMSTMDSISVTKPPAPSTPLKTATAMSRAASSNSMAQTPGDSTGLTPGTSDRPSTSHDGDSKQEHSVSSLRRKSNEHSRLGSELKHKRDDIVRLHASAGKGEAVSGLPTGDKKRAAALSLEMVMSYMVSFEALNQAKSLDRKVQDFQTWETLLPHLLELRNFTRGFKPLEGLTMQLHAIVLEELVKVYYGHELTTKPAGHTHGGGLELTKVGQRLIHYGKKTHEVWVDAHACISSISESSMKANLGPWTRPGAAAAAALHVLRRWADREGVDWRPQLALLMANGA